MGVFMEVQADFVARIFGSETLEPAATAAVVNSDCAWTVSFRRAPRRWRRLRCLRHLLESLGIVVVGPFAAWAEESWAVAPMGSMCIPMPKSSGVFPRRRQHRRSPPGAGEEQAARHAAEKCGEAESVS
jgi:hypothetical protein